MIGRVGGKAMLWFITASLVSLMLGFGFGKLLEPGHVTKLPIQDAAILLKKSWIILKGFFWKIL